MVFTFEEKQFKAVERFDAPAKIKQDAAQPVATPTKSFFSPFSQKETSNHTGVPTPLLAQSEASSGLSLRDVRVHYHSEQPAQLRALAYTSGNQIYLAPGQERHLVHELGHVIQQKQGIVHPTAKINGRPLNDDPALERDADHPKARNTAVPVATGTVIQRMVGMEFQCMGTTDVYEIENESETTAANGNKTITLEIKPSGHDLLIKEFRNFKLTADMGDYEFVTDPQDERTPGGLQALMQSCKDAAEVARNVLKALNPKKGYLVKAGTATRTETSSGQDVGKTASYSYFRFENVIVRQSRKGEENTAHPQSTVGIRLDRLYEFFLHYQDSVERAGSPGRTFLPEGRQPDKINALHLQASGEAVRNPTVLRDAIDTPLPGELSPSGKGLALMLRNLSLSAMKNPIPKYAKTGIPIMPRTNLGDLFALLPKEDQERILSAAMDQYIGPHEKLSRLLNSRVGYPKGQLHDWVNWEQQKEAFAKGPARQTGGKINYDNPFAAFDDISELGNQYKADGTVDSAANANDPLLKAFHISRSTQIYPVGDNPEGILLELRDLQADVPPKDWHLLARDCALLTKYANNPTEQKNAVSPKPSDFPRGSAIRTAERSAAKARYKADLASATLELKKAASVLKLKKDSTARLTTGIQKDETTKADKESKLNELIMEQVRLSASPASSAKEKRETAQLATQIKSLRATIAIIEKRIAKSEADLGKTQTAETSAKAAADERQITWGTLDTERQVHSSLEAEQTERAKQVHDLHVQLDQLRLQQKEKAHNLAANQSQRDSLHTKIELQKNSANAASEKLAQLKAALEAQSAKLTAFNQAAKQLDCEVQANSAQKEQFRAQAESLKTELAGLEKEHAELPLQPQKYEKALKRPQTKPPAPKLLAGAKQSAVPHPGSVTFAIPGQRLRPVGTSQFTQDSLSKSRRGMLTESAQRRTALPPKPPTPILPLLEGHKTPISGIMQEHMQFRPREIQKADIRQLISEKSNSMKAFENKSILLASDISQQKMKLRALQETAAIEKEILCKKEAEVKKQQELAVAAWDALEVLKTAFNTTEASIKERQKELLDMNCQIVNLAQNLSLMEYPI